MSNTIESIRRILDGITYKEWEFRLWPMGEGHLMQIVFTAPDTHTKEPQLQYCRKWWIDPNMTVNEIVRTCYLAVETAERHEMGEEFRYGGTRVANPHFSVPILADWLDAHPTHPLAQDDSRNLLPRDHGQH